MIFNEIYSAYYNSVAKIIGEILLGNNDEKSLNKIVAQNAFGESMLTVIPALKSEKWQLMKDDFTTIIKHKPTMPLTLIQKQWFKAICLDPRIKLFGLKDEGLEDVKLLFISEDYFVYDKYGDGDPYNDEKYIKHFRTLLEAIHGGRNVEIQMTNRKGKRVNAKCVPVGLEYSEKDDKFRLITSGSRLIKTVNVARIEKCVIYNGEIDAKPQKCETRYETITLKVSEKRNTLERCMMHFAHFEKRAEKVDDHYLLHIKFDKDDETEMVIGVLSFGPTVEAIGSDRFRKLIQDKLKKQKSCGLL